MCCSCSNIYPLLRNEKNPYGSAGTGMELPIYYANAFAAPLFPVVTMEQPDKVQFFHWGLVPAWVKSEAGARNIRGKTINARSETVFVKPSFALSALSHRCIVPVTGFFEWHEHGGKKYPFFLKVPGVKDFALAGIYSSWTDSATRRTDNTFSILTTKASEQVARIHNVRKRMPVILSPQGESCWLDPHATREELEKLLVPWPHELDAWPVKKISNRAGISQNVADTLLPFDYPELDEDFSPSATAGVI